ncbi:MAG: gfo/Idh/MocA family oxidoreductase [Segetibacter sp.]|nr:gfo/Idh/MocA family oxidoreductase [Segetibacter sp.]
MSRRSFIKNTSLLTGGLLLHNSLTKAFATEGAANKINIGIIGCGDRGKGLMLVMKELPDNFNVVAVCDVLDFRLKEAVKTAGATQVKTYTDYRQLLDDKNITAVAIATPLNAHFSIAADALKAGKHVYLEKTMTYNIDEAQDLVKLSKKYAQQTLQVGHQYRYTPLYFKVKEMIEKGYLGKVMQVDCRWDRNWNWKRPAPDPSLERKINWRMYREYSGGLPAELLSHQMDFINWAFQTHPNEVMGTGGIDFYKDGRETYDNVQVMFRYDKEGMIGNFGSTCGNARDGYLFKLKGTKGTVSLLMHEGIFYPEPQTKKELETVDGVTGATKITWNKDGGIPILKEPTKDGTWYALKGFYNCVTNKQQPVSNVITGATTAVCVHLANKSIYNGTIEKWKPAYNFS